jgi:uncharacterized protein (TIGR03118 family)
LVVTIPPSGSAPTGIVFNSAGPSSFGGAVFIFATEGGTIASWKGANGTSAVTAAITPDAVYKGLAIGNNGTTDLLYATNFRAGTVDVFNSGFGPAFGIGTFLDPNLPAGYAPFGIRNIGGQLYVTYAQQDAVKHDDVAGAGHGFVDVFDLNGSLLHRLVSNGPLNSPWGIALAPSNFGPFGNNLLIGNFGDGKINVFNQTTGAFVGQLDSNGNPIVIPGLWGLLFGNGGNGGMQEQLFFTAGIPGTGEIEDHGLFGNITVGAVPEPSTWAMILLGFVGLGFAFRQSRRKVSFA